MKNFYRPVKCETYKYITIVWVPQVESVKLMVQEHYDTEEYADTLFLINCLYSNEGLWLNKIYFPQKRKIYYNLEHKSGIDNDTHESLNTIRNVMTNLGITEVWTMESGINLYENNFKTEFRPVRYTTFIQPSTKIVEKTIDCGFVGVISKTASPNRLQFFDDYLYNYDIDFSMKILNGETISNFKDELANCKFVLDIKRDNYQVKQNQVRIFEHLCLGHTILSQVCESNMFPGLLYLWNSIEDLNDYVKNIIPENYIEKYKALTYSDDAYNKYIELVR